MKCVHLDFHTSPAIEGIGECFDREAFAATLKEAKVDLITMFAKCHHGYCYYPTKVGTVHPNLRFNLLKEQIEAAHSVGIKAPIYITMGWSKLDADQHPEWAHVDFWTKKPIYFGTEPGGGLDDPIYNCSWTTLCPIGGYREHLKDITREVCEMFDVSDGIFYDICAMRDACDCESCRAGMKARGMDPDSYEDSRRYYREERVRFYQELVDLIHSYNKDAHVFFNGCADMNRPEFHPVQSHYELEDLPTAWGGYDFMPPRAKYFEKFGKMYLGMTGKFHLGWGEFGGFKNKEALRYECADMLSVGASISVGDHLHPCGRLDEGTYRLIGHAFRYVDSIEEYTENTRAYTDLAMWMSHNTEADLGCAKLLQLFHREFDVVESGDDLSPYACVILPDCVKLTDADRAALTAFAKNGGKIVASYECDLPELGIRKTEKSPYDIDYIKCDLEDYPTPFLSYASAYQTEYKGEVVAEVYEPYFNRTWRHFCGHANTPNRAEPAAYPAMVKNENLVYFAHPVFTSYHRTGNYVLEKYVEKGLGLVYDGILKVTGFPSSGRIRVRKSLEKSFYAVHLLYAPPTNRGNACVLEDFPRLDGVTVSLKVPEPIKAVVVQPTGEALDFTQEDGVVTFTVNNMTVHQLIALEF